MTATGEKTGDAYRSIIAQLDALLSGESDAIANAANMSALIFQHLERINWAGVYIVRDGQLVLGPFQGKPACIRIPLGEGVCGTAASQMKTMLVKNVHEFDGHIACDADSQSELVVPLIKNDRVWGVLDIDSPEIGRFGEDDRVAIEAMAAVFVTHSNLS